MAMRQIWRIEKKRLRGGLERRVWLFDRLVWTVMGYRVDNWG